MPNVYQPPSMYGADYRPPAMYGGSLYGNQTYGQRFNGALATPTSSRQEGGGGYNPYDQPGTPPTAPSNGSSGIGGIRPTSGSQSPRGPFVPQMGMPQPAQQTATYEAEDDPRLTGLNDRYTRYLDDFEGNTGKIMDIAGTKLRDAREGGRSSLMAGEKLRGVGSSNRLAGYEADTTRGVAGTIGDIAVKREAEYGNAMRGGLPIAGAPGAANLAERNFGLNAATANNGMANNAFAQFMALLNSPWLSGGLF